MGRAVTDTVPPFYPARYGRLRLGLPSLMGAVLSSSTVPISGLRMTLPVSSRECGRVPGPCQWSGGSGPVTPLLPARTQRLRFSGVVAVQVLSCNLCLSYGNGDLYYSPKNPVKRKRGKKLIYPPRPIIIFS